MRENEMKKLLEEMKQIGIFIGKFDAKNGSWEFMNGVACVMDYLAREVSYEYFLEFRKEFMKNFMESVDKAREKQYHSIRKREVTKMEKVEFNINVEYHPEWKTLFLNCDGWDGERVEDVEEKDIQNYVGDYVKNLLTKIKQSGIIES